MSIQPLENIGRGGLTTDQPKESLDLAFWDEGLDLRSLDGSLRGVPDFDTAVDTIRLFQNTTDGPEYTTNVVSMRPLVIAQWTQAGSDQVDILTLGLDNIDGGLVYITGGGEDPAVVDVVATVEAFTYNQKFGMQAFVFNEIGVINTTTAPPMYSFDRSDFYILPNWFGEEKGSALTAVSIYTVYSITTVTTVDWSSIGGSTSAVVGDVFTATATDADITALGAVKILSHYHAMKMMPYNGRLVALNLYNDLDDGPGANDIRSPIEMAYSSSVSDIGTIIDLEWYASFKNTAGNLFLTQTPGRVVDAAQLGEFLMVYKTDSVIRMQDTGEPLFVVGDTAFLDDGILSQDCVVDIGSNRHFVVGHYGIYIHSGGPEKDTVSSDKVENYFYADLPASVDDRNLSFVFHHSLDKEVWTCYRHAAAATGASYKGCTRALVYNYDQGTWYLRTLPNITSMVETEIEGGIRIFAASPDVAPNSSVLGSLYELNNATFVADGYIQWTSRGLGNVNQVKFLDGLWPTSENSFEIRVETAPTPSPPDMGASTPKTFNPASAYKVDWRKLGRYYSVRFQMDGITDPKISACLADVRLEGER